MRRKVIKQGHNTLTITLPSKWVNNQGITPGDELDVSEQEKSLLISANSGGTIPVSTTIDISNLTPPIIWRYISSAYRAGYDEIAVTGIGTDKKSIEGNILFFPWMSRGQLPDYYSVCDVLVLPRPSHPATEIAAPTKFAEYTAMGKPILTTNVGDAAEFVRKYSCGIVVPSNSPIDLTKGIMQFRKVPKSELELMGKNSRNLAESQFDWSKVASNLLKAIQDMGLELD